MSSRFRRIRTWRSQECLSYRCGPASVSSKSMGPLYRRSNPHTSPSSSRRAASPQLWQLFHESRCKWCGLWVRTRTEWHWRIIMHFSKSTLQKPFLLNLNNPTSAKLWAHYAGLVSCPGQLTWLYSLHQDTHWLTNIWGLGWIKSLVLCISVIHTWPFHMH